MATKKSSLVEHHQGNKKCKASVQTILAFLSDGLLLLFGGKKSVFILFNNQLIFHKYMYGAVSSQS